MRAALYHKFSGPIEITEVADPVPADDGVVIQVAASGLCLSDWHGWKGHDADIQLPHVPGHELAGWVVASGKQVKRWPQGTRVTLPFACGCGSCAQCKAGAPNICDHHFQPGFTAWGSFAEYVAIPHADVNLVALPEAIAFDSAALLGCRVATAYRAIKSQGRVQAGEMVAVHGCGGVGLAAVAIAAALGARVMAVDIQQAALEQASAAGAELCINASTNDVVDAILEHSGGGAHLAIDALGSRQTCINALRCLRKRGRHVQVGLMTADDQHCVLPLASLIAKELEIIGSHGLAAHAYPDLLAMVASGQLDPAQAITRRLSLDQLPSALPAMGQFEHAGVAVIEHFGDSAP